MALNIEYPGTWLELPDREKAYDVESLLSSMDTSLIDMAITLTMFVDCQQNSYSEHTSDNRESLWERDRQLRMDIEKEYRDGLTNEHDFYNDHEHHQAEVDKRYRQKKLNNGEIPNSYKRLFPFTHAHSFLSSADTFYKYLSILSRETN